MLDTMADRPCDTKFRCDDWRADGSLYETLSGRPDGPRHLINGASLANGRRPRGLTDGGTEASPKKTRVSREEGVHQKAIGSGRESEGLRRSPSVHTEIHREHTTRQ
ncbi:hypothetical protein EYF80_014777 [Liparis tanakae]|uniref:Uncharacterized protein n=1 Tax=Liparis tanakae TaxID=230148 RepID=A0A4Z2IBF0_9TELE|nr:hypothetical protein EYF80_014777 [Liparis tanakae]